MRHRLPGAVQFCCELMCWCQLLRRWTAGLNWEIGLEWERRETANPRRKDELRGSVHSSELSIPLQIAEIGPTSCSNPLPPCVTGALPLQLWPFFASQSRVSASFSAAPEKTPVTGWLKWYRVIGTGSQGGAGQAALDKVVPRAVWRGSVGLRRWRKKKTWNNKEYGRMRCACLIGFFFLEPLSRC